MKSIFTAEIVHFLLAGAATLIVDYGVLVVLTEFVHIHYILSASVSFSLAVLANYHICLRWVFKNSSRQNKKQFIVFVITSIIGLVLNIGIMKLSVDGIGVHYFVGKIVATVIVTIWNYITKKKSLEMV